MRACQAIRTVAHGPVTRRFAVAAPAPYLWARPALACRVPPAGAGCPRRFFSAEKKGEEEEAKSGGLLGSIMGFVKSAIEGGEGSAESGFAAVLCEGLKSDEIKSQRHSAKELSWLCGDDNRHLGMTGGVINANRLAVIECGGLEILVPLLNGGDPKTAEHVASALAGILKHEEAIELVHSLGGTAGLVEAYNRSATGKLDQLRENAAKALQRMSAHADAREIIEAGVPDYEELQAINLGQ